MAANSGDLAQSLIEGGLSATAARIIANALANASSPQLSAGNDRVDSTPTAQLRLITPETRKYQLTNLDYSPSEPFQKRISENLGAYTAGQSDHPYKDSQPVSPTPPLAQPSIRGSDYIAVNNVVERNSNVAEVSLDLRLDAGGRHLRLDPSTKSLESVPFIARAEVPRFLASEFRETEVGTELVHGLRNLSKMTVVLSNGGEQEITAFSETTATSGQAFGGWGSFTPAFYVQNTPATVTYALQYGRYFRIGKLVVIYGAVGIATNGFTVTTAIQNTGVRIGPLPFEVLNRVPGTIGYLKNWQAVTADAGTGRLASSPPGSGFVQKAAGSTASFFFLRGSLFENASTTFSTMIGSSTPSEIHFCAFYETPTGTLQGQEDVQDQAE